jgi:succinate dehydrogenase/fumarate reductase flavoprotein subunit
MSRPPAALVCDVLVIGSGAGGLTTAITARKRGLDVIVVEKEAVFGGTTAFSGGVLWVPNNHLSGSADSREQALTYIRHEVGNQFDQSAVETFLDHGPEMLRFLEAETEVAFVPTAYPDYHPDSPGGVPVGRSILAAPYNAKSLGKDLKRLRPPLKTITFLGMMFNSSNADIKHFFNATRSLKSFVYVARRLASHLLEVAVHGRGVMVTSGNALAARLAKSALDLGIPIHTSAPALKMLREDSRVVGALVALDGVRTPIRARRAVVLASGGFARNRDRIAGLYPHLKRGGEHHSPVPAGNTGDGLAMAETAGAVFRPRFPNSAAWMPVSLVPQGNGEPAAFPHLLDRYKPGVIGVGPDGRRFTNESHSYHDVGAAIIGRAADSSDATMWLVCDERALRKYGLGFVKPAPLPIGAHLRSGYLRRGRTIEELAGAIGVDPDALRETVARYNAAAGDGEDPEFGRGTTAFNRFLGDPDHRPNPNVAPLAKPPFYAVRLYMGDLGTFDGIDTTPEGQVLDGEGKAIPGLYAAGGDRASVFGGQYPGAGITLGPIMTFGYVTGNAIANQQP